MKVSVTIALLALFVSSVAGQRGSFVIDHVTVIDATGRPAIRDMTVVIKGNRIAEIGKSKQINIARSAKVVNATGKVLIPGLWDMHGHLTNATATAFPLLIINGVTGVRDVGGNLEQIDRWRKEIESGKRLGPHIVRAGAFVDGPKPGLRVRNRLIVTNASEARRAIDTLKQSGVYFIKVHNGLSRESFFAVADAARKQGLPLAVHLPTGFGRAPGFEGMSVAAASDAGANSLEHIEILLESSLYAKGATAKTIDEAIAENLGPTGQALFARLQKNGTYYVPTLIAYHRGFVLWNNPKETEGSLEVHRKHLELVRAMHKAGVEILTGTDFSDWATVPGVDLHNELALFVEAGFTPMEAL